MIQLPLRRLQYPYEERFIIDVPCPRDPVNGGLQM
jgi:hypothetical protein